VTQQPARFFVIIFLFIYQSSFAQSLDTELTRLKTNVAILVNSGEVEERALWSPRSDYVAFRLAGKWMKIPLAQVELVKGSWHGKRIGTLKSTSIVTELDESELKLFRAASEVQPIIIRTKAGTTYALKPDGDGFALVATKLNGQTRQLWSSGGEACFSLSLSPDEKYLSCLGERSGLLLTKVE
jgi:hypothetical protein